MKIGVNTWVWVSPFGTDSFDLVSKIRGMGFDVMEIAVDDLAIIDRELLKRLLADNGLAATVCGAFGPTRDISSDDPGVRRNGVQYVTECLRFAEIIGARVFAGPLYSAVGKTRLTSDEEKRRERGWCIENMREIAKVAADCGVTIGVEPLNRFESDMINLVAQAVSLIDEVGSAVYKVHIDTFHANIEEKSIPQAIRGLGKDRLCHLHACENDRGVPGTGHQDWVGIREALREIEYDGAAVIESFTPGAKEIAKAASIWRPLARSQDELAREGARFLRKLLG